MRENSSLWITWASEYEKNDIILKNHFAIFKEIIDSGKDHQLRLNASGDRVEEQGIPGGQGIVLQMTCWL